MDTLFINGYPVPNPCYSSSDFERLHCQDLETMSPIELRAERVALLAVLGLGDPSGLRTSLTMPSVHLNPVPFAHWAECRIVTIDKILGRKQQGMRTMPVVLDPEEV